MLVGRHGSRCPAFSPPLFYATDCSTHGDDRVRPEHPTVPSLERRMFARFPPYHTCALAASAHWPRQRYPNITSRKSKQECTSCLAATLWLVAVHAVALLKCESAAGPFQSCGELNAHVVVLGGCEGVGADRSKDMEEQEMWSFRYLEPTAGLREGGGGKEESKPTQRAWLRGWPVARALAI
jgi:hypothetical protein